VTAALKLRVPEADFQGAVIDLARTLGWMVHHVRPAMTSKGWRTPIAGDPGYPDLTLVRDRLIVAELKSSTGRVRPDQKLWIAALRAAGVECHIWRPSDWPLIEQALTSNHNDMTMTAKQAAAQLRGWLNRAQTAADQGGHLQSSKPTGEQFTTALPAGLRFAVRATRSGVNVTIEDGGYVDRVTNGDRRAFGAEHKQPVVDEVERIRAWTFDGQLPGKTEWAPVLISATLAGATRIGVER